MWLEAMEEIDEVEAEFLETLRGNDGETSSETRGTTEIAGAGTPPYSP